MDSDQSQGKTIDERLDAVMQNSQQSTAETQPEPMPSSSQPTEEPVDDLSLPENVSERTRKQFEKLKTRLADAEAKVKTSTTPEPTPSDTESVFDIPQPKFEQTQPATQFTPTPQQFVDAEGNFDVDGFNRALKDANDRAYIAQLEAQKAQEAIAKFEHNQQTKEALSNFKELDATKKETFDPKFAELVRRELIANISLAERGIEKRLTYNEIAQRVSGYYKPINTAKVQEETAAQIKQAQAQRQQGPIESGRGEPRVTQDQLQELRERTRRGDGSALSERLRSIGI